MYSREVGETEEEVLCEESVEFYAVDEQEVVEQEDEDVQGDESNEEKVIVPLGKLG